MARQHLYPCACCGVYGVAHYILQRVAPDSDPAPFVNTLVCTGCHQAKCQPPAACAKPRREKRAVAHA